MRHPDDGTLMALLDGEIPSDELAPITEHLDGCEECRARLDAAGAMMTASDNLIGALGDMAPAMADPSVLRLPRRSRTVLYRNLAWAATVAMAAGLGYSMRGPDLAPAPATVALEPSVGATEVPTATVPDATAQSVEQERPAAPPTMQAARTEEPPAATPPAPAAGFAAGVRARAADTANRAEKSAEQPTAAPPTRPGAVSPQVAGRTVARLAPPSTAAAPMMLSERAMGDMESFAPIGFAEAIARLGGSIRLVDGLVPDRLEASSTTVRVVYPLETGELLLEQRLMGDSISVFLSGPVSRDSLAV
ncbi:MAG TPA: zf-HC2 domain-containing protein, partial [Gemmatimonadales bacterium]|nr:zf-HC2 domain-containing protein [Gemmatimonadales bacterium]